MKTEPPAPLVASSDVLNTAYPCRNLQRAASGSSNSKQSSSSLRHHAAAVPMQNSWSWSEQFFFLQGDESVSLPERDEAEDTRGAASAISTRAARPSTGTVARVAASREL